MRLIVRMGLAVLGLAVAAPHVVWADPPASAANQPPGHTHRKGLFRRTKHCPECQRAKLQAQGINMPAPPPLPQGVVVEGGSCPTCVAGGGQVVMTQDGSAPGYTVVGGQGSAPGYAVVGGEGPTSEPMPIGAVAARGAHPAAGRPGMADPSVMPTSIPSPPEPVRPAGHNRPNVLGHLFGVTALGRHQREETERRRREKHASIHYDQQSDKVTELPASVVYKKRWWQSDSHN
jgi:hypothetical protein